MKEHRTLIWKNAVALGLLLLLANTCIGYAAIAFRFDTLQCEDGLLENMQAVFLALAALSYLYLVIAPGTTHDKEGIAHAGIGLLCFSFLLRELDLELLPVPDLIQTIGSGTGKRILLTVLWLSLIVYAIAYRQQTLRQLRRYLEADMLLIFGNVCLLLALSFLIDRKYFLPTHAMLIEELVETTAYLLILLPVAARARSSLLKPPAD